MKYIDEFRDKKSILALLEEIKNSLQSRPP